jgi:FkbM family methyltransferase
VDIDHLFQGERQRISPINQKAKDSLKSLFASMGFAVQRLPRGLPSGHSLARDIAIVVGGKPGAICIDAGANVGAFVGLLLKALPGPVVHAFEPAPGPFGILRERYGNAAGVHLVQSGLSDHPGELELNVFDNQTLNSFLPMAEGADRTLGGAAWVAQVRASVVRLDEYAAKAGIGQIDLLKIDTQGYERQVLKGAEGLLAQNRIGAVLVELNFVPLYENQVWAHELIGLLQGHSFYLVDFYEKCRLGPFLGWCTALFARRDPVAPRSSVD